MARFSVRAALRGDDGRVRWFVPLTLAFLLVSAGVAWAGDLQSEALLSSDVNTPSHVQVGDNVFTIHVWLTGNQVSDRTGFVVNRYFMDTDGAITASTDADDRTAVFFAAMHYNQCDPFNPPLGCASNPHVVSATLVVAPGTLSGTEGALHVELILPTVTPTQMGIGHEDTGYVVVIADITYVTNGFKSPVATGDWNKARAGQGISLRWNLWEDEQTVENELIDPVLNGDSYSIRSMRIACPTNGAFDPDDVPAEYAGSSSLRYDYDEVVENASGHNVFVWKTDRGWDGTCRQLTIMYDGSATDPPLTAFFDFRK